MAKSNLLFLLLLLLPGISAEVFYLENLSAPVSRSGTLTTYVFENESPSFQPSNFTVQNQVILEWEEWNETAHYSIATTGGGIVQMLTDPRCDGTHCALLNGDPDVGLETVQLEHTLVALNSNHTYVFNISFFDLDTEPGEFLRVYFFNGVSYDIVYQYNGTDNGLTNGTWGSSDSINISLPLSSTYTIPTFRWLLESSFDDLLATGSDAYILDSVTLAQTSPTSFRLPSFYHLFGNATYAIDTATINHSFAASSNQTLTWTLTHFTEAGIMDHLHTATTTTGAGTGSRSLSLHTLTESFLANETLALHVTVNLSGNQSFTLPFHNNETFVELGLFQSALVITSFSFDNTSFPFLLNMSYTNDFPLVNVTLYRDGVFLNLMYLCGLQQYCYLDDTVSAENGSAFYQVIIENTIGQTAEDSLLALFDPLRGILIYPQYQGEFYVDVNTSTLFSLLVVDADGDIITDALISLNFTTMGQEFSLTYNPTTQMYETSLLFATEGDFPFTIELGPAFYMIDSTQNTAGIVHVRESGEVCIQLFTDQNVTNPYINDLGTILLMPENSSRLFGVYDILTNGATGVYNFSMFHGAYLGGEACIDMFSLGGKWEAVFVDGSFQFKDNYDPPEVIYYRGTYVTLPSFAPTPGSTYKFYVPAIELRYANIFHKIGPAFIFLLILVFSILAGVITLEMGGRPLEALFASGAALGIFLLLWLFVEIFLKVFM